MPINDPRARALMIAVRPTVILKYLAQLLLMLAALTLVPTLTALFMGETEIAKRYAGVIGLLLILSIPLARLPSPKRFQRNEALCVTALAFIISPLLMSYPMMASGLSFLDAWFEAVSGVTTTGLSTLTDVESKPAIFLFGRAWMQWYGGLGVAVLAVALFMGHHITSKKLLESAGEEGHTTTAHIYARQVLLIYLILTAVGLLLAWLIADNGFMALIHVLSAISTGGFSGFNDSLASLSPGFRFAIMLIAFAGAICLPLYYMAYQRGVSAIIRDQETQTLVMLTLLSAGMLGIILNLTHPLSWSDALTHAATLGVSAQSTAGFSSLDLTTLSPAAKLVLILTMITGGSAGSTAGGVKIIRFLVLLRLIQITLQRTAMPPRAVLPPRLGRAPLESDDMVNVLVLLGLWGTVVLLSWLAFLFYGYAPLDALFEVVSATGTVGLSTGITNPDLEPPLKLLLGIDMLLGRLEIITLLVLLYPGTWIGRRRNH